MKKTAQRKSAKRTMPVQTHSKPGPIKNRNEPATFVSGTRVPWSFQAPGSSRNYYGGRLRIGRAVGVLFAREGADVALIYLPAEQSRKHKDS